MFKDFNPALLGAMILAANTGRPGNNMGNILGNAVGNYGNAMAQWGNNQRDSQLHDLKMQQLRNQMADTQLTREKAARIRELRGQLDRGEINYEQYLQKADAAAYGKLQMQKDTELAKYARTRADKKSDMDYQARLDAMNTRIALRDQAGLEQHGPAYFGMGSSQSLPRIGDGSSTQLPSLPFQVPYKSKVAIEEEKQKGAIKGQQKRIDALNESKTSRRSNLAKAKEFLAAFKGKWEDGTPYERGGDQFKAESGLGRAYLNSNIPFTDMPVLPTFTEQGRFDEDFNAFAETAAREALKASGEIRPTDEDVQGMKRAMFGIGRDEQVNIRLLEQFIRDQEADEREFMGSQGFSIERVK